MSVKSHFSIKDLENLSGVKAHTIRIWEKRYALLSPERSDTNIRKYNLTGLKKLLNVTLLYNEGVKISKIASFDENQIQTMALDLKSINKESFAINSLKTAMLNFDSDHFNHIYNTLVEKREFKDIFFSIFVPFLNELGVLWHTNSIDPSHERFISELIKRKMIVHIENQWRPSSKKSKKAIFCLYLPENEIHDIGLLYANYELEKSGFKTIYLGQHISLNILDRLAKQHENIVFVSYFTIYPEVNDLEPYLENFNEIICSEKSFNFWILGNKGGLIKQKSIPKNITFIHSINDFLENIENITTL